MPEAEYDRSFFKILRNNDLPGARGHQAGPAIPRALRAYLPLLAAESIGPGSPTVDDHLFLDLWSTGERLGSTEGRYQLQTWGGSRSPEARITTPARLKDSTVSLRRLLERAVVDDILVFGRRRGGTHEFRVTLVGRTTTLGKQLASVSEAYGSRWGPADPDNPPMTMAELMSRTRKIAGEFAASPFIEADADRGLSTSERLRRDDAFRLSVRRAYQSTCCVCGGGFVTLRGHSEVEAAHIIPVGEEGADIVPNGLSLCRSHHWAFDRGLMWIDRMFQVWVTPDASSLDRNEALLEYHGAPLRLPSNPAHRPDPRALDWHAENVAGVQ